MKLVINLPNDRIEPVAISCINKLYDLTRAGTLDGTSSLVGYINASSAYLEYIDYLRTAWPDLIITASNIYIRFEDNTVKQVLLNNNIGDGEGVTTAQALAANIKSMFTGNTSITSFNELKYFKDETSYNFEGCTSLESIDMTGKGGSTKNCTNLTNWHGGTKPNGYLLIGNYEVICYGCTNLTEVEIETGSPLTRFNNNVFRNTSVDIVRMEPSANFLFGYPAFAGYTLPTKLYITNLENLFSCIDISHTGFKEKNLDIYVNNVLLETLTIPSTVTVLKDCFANCKSLLSVTFHNDITTVNSTFKNCINLVIPNLSLPNLTSLGNESFMETKVQTVSNLGSITTIPARCFRNCTLLTEVNLPSTCKLILDWAFKGCSNLQIINLQNIETLNNTYASCAFELCDSLIKFGGPNSTDGEIYMPNLTGTLNGLRLLGNTITHNITSLGTITSIGNGGVMGTKIGTITLPSTLTHCSNNAFFASSAQIVNWQGTMDLWVNITFDAETSNPVGSDTEFKINGVAPTSYSFPSGTATIKKWCLKYIKTLTSVTIPNTVTNIGNGAFYGCKGLTTITLPPSLTTIEGDSFGGNSNLVSVIFESTTPPTWTSVPSSINYDIYVPEASVNAYKAASGWSNFASRIQAIPNT